MRVRRVRVTVLLMTLVLGGPRALDADDRGSTVAGPAGGWTVEFVGDLYRETWDYNLFDEDLFGGSANLLYRVSPRWSIGAEALILGVRQEPIPSTALSGIAPLIRWRCPARRLTCFAEGGGGVSYAAGIVPNQGTRFNYIAHLGFGFMRPIGSRASFVGSLRWLHLSNYSLAGRSRNPDIQAIGVRLGVAMPLSR